MRTMHYVLAAFILVGCTSGQFPFWGTFVIDAIDPTFDADLMFVNVTVSNHSNLTFGGGNTSDPMIAVEVDYFRNARGDPSAKADMTWDNRTSEEIIWISATKTEPKRPAYYDRNAVEAMGYPDYNGRPLNPGFYGPRTIPGGSSETVTFAFKLLASYRHDEGYYAILVSTAEAIREHEAGTVRHTGCFNVDTPMYFGRQGPSPECPVRRP